MTVDSDERAAPTNPVDELVAAGVRDRTAWLQGSARISASTEMAQQSFDETTAALAAVESALGRHLPQAREVLARVASDPWARVAASKGLSGSQERDR